jgi:hypothetical protein
VVRGSSARLVERFTELTGLGMRGLESVRRRRALRAALTLMPTTRARGLPRLAQLLLVAELEKIALVLELQPLEAEVNV